MLISKIELNDPHILIYAKFTNLIIFPDTDTDFSESEALSSLQTSGAQQQTKQNTTTTTTTAAVSQSEPEDISGKL